MHSGVIEGEMTAIVQAAFNERQKIYQQWQAAQVSLTKKREKKARLELQGQSDKLPTARAECQEQAMRVANIEIEFERMSKMLKAELERWDAQRVRELKSSLAQYIEALAHTQQEVRACRFDCAHFGVIAAEQILGDVRTGGERGSRLISLLEISAFPYSFSQASVHSRSVIFSLPCPVCIVHIQRPM